MNFKNNGFTANLKQFISLGLQKSELSEPLTRDYQTLDGQMTSLGGIKVNKVITNVFQVEDDGQVFMPIQIDMI